MLLTAIAAGDSQGVFLKLSTFGKESLWNKARDLAGRLRRLGEGEGEAL